MFEKSILTAFKEIFAKKSNFRSRQKPNTTNRKELKEKMFSFTNFLDSIVKSPSGSDDDDDGEKKDDESSVTATPSKLVRNDSSNGGDLLRLPREIFAEILLLLEVHDICHVAQTCYAHRCRIFGVGDQVFILFVKIINKFGTYIYILTLLCVA